MSVCATCSRELQPEWKFCIYCGTPTGVPLTAAIEIVRAAAESEDVRAAAQAAGSLRTGAITIISSPIPTVAPEAAPNHTPIPAPAEFAAQQPIFPQPPAEKPITPHPTSLRDREMLRSLGRDVGPEPGQSTGTGTGTGTDPSTGTNSTDQDHDADPETDAETAAEFADAHHADTGEVLKIEDIPADEPVKPAADAAAATAAAPLARVNVLAVLALILGCLVSPLAAVFGHLALTQISKSGERGTAIAWVAIVLGYLSLAALLVIGISYFVLNA
jgi:hypothetical protein